MVLQHHVTFSKRSIVTAAAFTMLALWIAGCGGGKNKINGVRYPYVGVASWYGEKFHGRQTANGERYNMMAMTAAHRSLPFNTVVRVTNLENGRSVRLRINDRGPFVRGRSIDVSYGAARKLGMVQQGLARVQIDIIRSPLAYFPSNAGQLEHDTGSLDQDLSSYAGSVLSDLTLEG